MYAIIMCGGSGTRFWPVSRQRKPKQFLDITGGGPMVVETCDRLKPTIDDKDMILVLGNDHLEQARELFQDRGVHIVAEPVGKNTAPCIGLGAIYAQHLGCREAVAFLPADHFISAPSSFMEALGAAGKLAMSGGIVTLGIVPTRPETGYGYIRRASEKIEVEGPGAYRVVEFVEKPDLETARRYLTDGEYYWNGGIFVATPETILEETEKHLPDLYKGLMRLKAAVGTKRFESEFEEVYNGLTGISFDYGIMEKTRANVYVVPCECGWSDVGSWSSLYELRTAGYDENQNLIEGETHFVECEKSFISSQSGRLVACLGIDNCLVVDTPDAVLVSDLNRSQEIRKIVDQLKASGKEKLL
jgi:mannose-1-phosphate guanylyltransferase